MPVELNIVESATALDTTVVDVILTSASEPGPAGPAGQGVPTGGTAGQVLTKDSGTDYDTSWQSSPAAPADADYLVGTASGALSAEIVVGTAPGGELGGTWASPTVDATHSGSSHASIQAAAEATAAAALAAHEADTTGIHGVADTAALETSAGAQAKVDTHVNDATDAHAGTAITNTPAGNIAATTVQAAINELDSEKATTASAVMDGDAAGGVLSGTYPNPGFAADMATQAELDAHTGDTSAAHAATAISVDSTTLVGTGTDVQAVFEELDNAIADHLADTADAHDASAISVADAGGYFAGTDVEAALQEVGAKFDEIAYVEFTSSVSVTATSEASPTEVVTSGAISYDGSRICIEFYAPEMETGATAGSFTIINLWDATTDLGRIAVVENSAAAVVGAPCHVKRYLTPTAASHTYRVRAFRVNSNGTITAGLGGAGTSMPGFIRITRAP